MAKHCVSGGYATAEVHDAAGAPVAIWPYTVEKKWTLTLIRNPLLTPYLGPVFLQEVADREAVLAQLYAQLPSFDFCSAQCLPDAGFTAFFEAKGFSCKPRTTFILDLQQPEEVLFKGIKDSRRSLIRKAEKELTITDGSSAIESFYAMHQTTFRDKSLKYPYSPSFFKNLLSETTARNSGQLHIATGSRLQAGAFTVQDGATMYLLLTAFDRATAHQGAVSLLIWNAIRKAKSLGLSQFDFEGSSDPGIATFFRSFGGRQTTYLSCTKTPSPLWRLKQKLLG